MAAKKCVWLKARGAKALNAARANILNNNPSSNHTDESITTHALEFYNLHKALDKPSED